MADELRNNALEALDCLIEAAQVASEPYIADQFIGAKRIIKGRHSTLETKLNSAIGVCGGLSGRGEWDRILVESGDLPYLSLFEVPIAVYQYFETLSLKPNDREFVKEQIRRLQYALKWHRKRLLEEEARH